MKNACTSACYLIILLLFPYFVFSQGEGNVWYFGRYAAIDFNSGTPVALFSSAMNTDEGCSTMCDPEGNLLFYTDGITIWNRKHNIMRNGQRLNGHSSSTQSGTIIPHPGSKDIFFVFTIDSEGGGDGLCYSMVDMSMSGGDGAVTQKNLKLINQVSEKITAVKHTNGADTWVIVHEYGNNKFYSYKITTAGLVKTPVISSVGSDNADRGYNGYLKASPKGNKIASAIYYENFFEIFDFDNSTGKISNPIKVDYDTDQPYGVEFSPNGNMLYISTFDEEDNSGHIYQYNITENPISYSETEIATPKTSGRFGMQLAPDGKIYVVRQDYNYLGAINKPDSYGYNSNYVDEVVSLGDRFCTQGLPTYIQTYFYGNFLWENICKGETTKFYFSNTKSISSVQWNFGDVSSGNNSSTELSPLHVFSKAGKYNVSVDIKYNNFQPDTNYTQEVIIYDYPKVNLGKDTTICFESTVLLNAGNKGSNYKWQDGSGEQTFLVTTPGTYNVYVANNAGCESFDEKIVNFFTEIGIKNQSVRNITCNGSKNGSFEFTSSGGGGTLSFSIDNVNFKTSSKFEGLSKGKYNLYIKDSKGCKKTFIEAFEILEPETLKINEVNVDNINCYNANNAKIIIKANGGSGNLSYSINKVDYQDINVFENLKPADYKVYVKDENKCLSEYEKPVKITNPLELKINKVDKTNLTCNGTNDGTIKISAEGGTGVLKYELNNEISQSNPEFALLKPAFYNLKVTDEAGCFKNIDSIEIKEPEPLTISSIDTSVNMKCWYDNNGTVKINANGGTGLLKYSIDGGINYSDSAYFKNLGGKKYSAIVKDKNNCTSKATEIIMPPSEIIITSEKSTSITCYNANNGTITIVANGGTGSLRYLLNDSVYYLSGDIAKLVGGTYKVTVVDQNNCKLQSTINHLIKNPEQLIFNNLKIHPVSCHNGSNGELEILTKGGTLPLSYKIDNEEFKQTNVYENIKPGNLQISVRDFNNCLIDSTLTINNPVPITITHIGTKDLLCHNSNDGEISFTATGGNGNLKYRLQNTEFQNDTTFLNLKSDNYQIIITDQKGCSLQTTDSIYLKNPDLLVIDNQELTNITCFGANNGTIAVKASGGVGNLSYMLNNQQFNITGNFQGLKPQFYKITIKDENKCQIESSQIEIKEPDKLLIKELTKSDITCYNANDGEILVKANGGTGLLKYTLSSGISNFNGVFKSLKAGEYFVTVSDSNNCFINSDTIEIISPKKLQIVSIDTTNNIICPGEQRGVIDLKAEGGTGELKFSIDNGLNFSPSGKFTKLSGGVYDIIVEDINKCRLEEKGITIYPMPVIIDTIIEKDITCFGQKNGLIEIKVSEGMSPFTFSLNNKDYKAGRVFENLSKGKYNVFIKDSNKCVITSRDIEITEPQLLKPKINIVESINCFGDKNGVVEVNVIGGIGKYKYNWNDPLSSSDTIVYNLAPNIIYKVKVTDDNFCEAADSVLLSEPEKLTTSFSNIRNITCFGLNNGSVSVIAKGGTSPYQFLWSNNDKTSTADSLLANTWHTIITTDKNLCVYKDSIQLSEPQELTSSIVNIQNITCFGANNGSAIVKVKGGTTPYNLLWDNKLATKDTIIANLEPDRIYHVVVTDKNKCKITDSVKVTQPPLLKVEITDSVSVKCYGDSNGEATATVSGGISPYTIYWFDSAYSTTKTAKNLKANQLYQVKVSDKNSCIALDTIILGQPPKIEIQSINKQDITCFKANDGKIEIAAIGGTGKLSYILNNKIYQIPDIQDLKPGSYNIDIQDQNQCKSSTDTTIVITEPAKIEIDSLMEKELVCYGDTIGEIAMKAIGGIGKLQYNFNNSFFEDSCKHHGLGSGDYLVLIQDENKCVLEKTISIIDPEKIQIIVTDSVMSCNQKATASFTYEIDGGIPDYITYITNPQGDTINATTKLLSGIYTIRVTDKIGCKNDRKVTLPDDDCKVEVPNVITPFNNDGKNDFLQLFEYEFVENYSIYIYNRWGNEIFRKTQSTDLKNMWDGRTNREKNAPEGVYYYVMRVKKVDGQVDHVAGYIHIVGN